MGAHYLQKILYMFIYFQLSAVLKEYQIKNTKWMNTKWMGKSASLLELAGWSVHVVEHMAEFQSELTINGGNIGMI